MQVNVNGAWLTVLLIIGLALCTAGLSFLLPVADTVQNSLAAHMRTAMAALAAVSMAGAAFWFLGGLSSFKAQSRKAYGLFSSGLIIFGIALLQLPIIGLFDLWQSFWTVSGAALIPLLLPLLLIYFGMRMFTKLLRIQTVLTSFWVVVAGATAIVLITLFLGPIFIRVDNPQTVAVSLAAIAWGVVFSGVSAMLLHRVKVNIGPYYKKARPI